MDSEKASLERLLKDCKISTGLIPQNGNLIALL